MQTYPITKLGFDSTKILPCRSGDILISVKDVSSVWDPKSRYDITDFWQMKDGDQVILTNRLDDVPTSIPLHPTMVGGRSNINKMLRKLNLGYSPVVDVDITNLSEVWKLNINDYIIWSGVNRPDAISYIGILGVFEFETGSLATIQNYNYSIESIDDIALASAEHLQQIRGAFEFIKRKELKRRGTDEWRLG